LATHRANKKSFNFSDFRFWKPFNPLLGETFEYHNEEHGYSVIAEQVTILVIITFDSEATGV